MELALKYVDDEKKIIRRYHASEAVKGHNIYFCPECGEPVYKREGKLNSPHFSHERNSDCVGGYYGTYNPMSDWHKNWQKCFPKENQEIWKKDIETGRSHRADVLIDGTVIEFQHSVISKNEFDKRNSFWNKLGYKIVWLFDLRSLYLQKITEKCYMLEFSDEPFYLFEEDDINDNVIVFVEYPLKLHNHKQIWNVGYNIIRPSKIIGNKDTHNAKFYFDFEQPKYWYDKNRFLSFCGLKGNKKGHYITEIIDKYKGSPKIAAYNYITNEDLLIEEDVVFDFENDWATIYHFLTKEEEERIDKQKKEFLEHNRKVREENFNNLLKMTYEKLDQIKFLYSDRTAKGKAFDKNVEKEVLKLSWELMDMLSIHNIKRTKTYDNVQGYCNNLDGYYLAILRELPEIAEIRKQDADAFRGAIIKLIVEYYS